MPNTQHRDLQDKLNRCMPVAGDVKLGDLLQEIITAYNDLAAKHDALLEKLDADAGVNDADYGTTLAAGDVLADINER